MKGNFVLIIISIIIISSGTYRDAIGSANQPRSAKTIEKENIVTLTGFEQSLKMLQAGRIDIFIAGTLGTTHLSSDIK